jgi:hypothetical protein
MAAFRQHPKRVSRNVPCVIGTQELAARQSPPVWIPGLTWAVRAIDAAVALFVVGWVSRQRGVGDPGSCVGLGPSALGAGVGESVRADNSARSGTEGTTDRELSHLIGPRKVAIVFWSFDPRGDRFALIVRMILGGMGCTLGLGMISSEVR